MKPKPEPQARTKRAEKKPTKAKPSKLKTERKATTRKNKSPDEFPLRCSIRLLRDKKIGTMQLSSEKELRRFNEKMKLPGQRTWLRFEMRRILRTSLHDDNDAGHPQHRAWEYCELFKQLWGWLKLLSTKAKNRNIQSYAGRAMGELIQELGSNEGKRWVEELSQSNEAFKDQITPFPGRAGGAPSKEDLRRWVRGEMSGLEWHWEEAMKISRRVETGRFASLKDAWTDYFNRLPKLLHDGERELMNHPFTKLSHKVLSSFPQLWEAALKQLVRSEWEQERKALKLTVKGEQNFKKRFGDVKDKLAGYHVAERHFNQSWRRKWESVLESDKVSQQFWEERKAQLKQQWGLMEMNDADFQEKLIAEFMRDLE